MTIKTAIVKFQELEFLLNCVGDASIVQVCPIISDGEQRYLVIYKMREEEANIQVGDVVQLMDCEGLWRGEVLEIYHDTQCGLTSFKVRSIPDGIMGIVKEYEVRKLIMDYTSD